MVSRNNKTLNINNNVQYVASTVDSCRFSRSDVLFDTFFRPTQLAYTVEMYRGLNFVNVN